MSRLRFLRQDVLLEHVLNNVSVMNYAYCDNEEQYAYAFHLLETQKQKCEAMAKSMLCTYELRDARGMQFLLASGVLQIVLILVAQSDFEWERYFLEDPEDSDLPMGESLRIKEDHLFFSADGRDAGHGNLWRHAIPERQRGWRNVYYAEIDGRAYMLHQATLAVDFTHEYDAHFLYR